ncbi:MAG: Classical-complement-pathway convertase [Rhodospirillales bacterium]|nr:Classical-complement-pathway convertase [Rhodospirillales bacterium]
MAQRTVFFILIVIAAAAGGVLFAYQSAQDESVRVTAKGFSGLARIGGTFQLTDHHGRTVSDTDLRGRPALIFFGYTQCPDVCPMTLLRLTEALELLGHDFEAIQPVFITVDPLRDTPEVIADYISNFDPRFIGLTGTRQQIAGVERAFAVYAKAAEGAEKNANYLVDHTALTYLMGPDGAFRAFIQQTLSPSEMAQKIREHL